MFDNRAPKNNRNLEARRRYVDTRSEFRKLLDGLRLREYLGLAYIANIVMLSLIPTLWLVSLVVFSILHFNAKLDRKKIGVLPLKLPVWMNKIDYHEPAVADRFKFEKASGTIHMGNELSTQLELWIVPKDLLTHLLFISTTGGGKTEFLWSLAATSSFMTGGALIYVDAKAAPDGLEKLYFLGRKTGREDSIRIMNYRTGNKEVKHSHWKKVSNTCGMFAVGTASVVQQFLEDMMPPGEGENQVFRDKAVGGLKAFLPCVVELRDQKLVNITPSLIGQWFTIPILCKLAWPEHNDHLIPLENETTGETIEIPHKVSKQRQRALRRYLENLPSFDADNPDKLRNGIKQPSEVHRQFGFGLGYISKPLVELGSAYSHIFECEQGEIDFRDIILNNRLLGVFVPATEQSKDQRQVQGKIALSGIRVAISTGLGEDSEGDLDDIINNLPIDKKNPSLIIIDEYAEVAIEGFAVAATQGRGLGIGVCFSGQDLAGFIKASKEEATQIFGNTRLKILGPQEDVKETWDWFKSLGGTMNVAESNGWNEGNFSAYKSNLSAQIKEIDRLNWLDVKEQIEGEGYIFQSSNLVRAQLFNIRLNTKELGNFRITRLLEVLPPSEKEKNELLKKVELSKAIEYSLERNILPSNSSLIDLKGSEPNLSTDWIYKLLEAQTVKEKEVDALNKEIQALEKPIEKVETPASKTHQQESAFVKTTKNKEVTLPDNSSFIYDFDIDIDNDTLGSLEKSLSHISQKLGVSTDDADKLSSETVESLSSELKYTKTEIESREDDLELLTAEFSKLLKADK